jgi:hypothetical protein
MHFIKIAKVIVEIQNANLGTYARSDFDLSDAFVAWVSNASNRRAACLWRIPDSAAFPCVCSSSGDNEEGPSGTHQK